MEENKKLRFYGGVWVSFLPIIVFILITLCFTLQGAPDMKGLWLGAFAGVFVTFFLAKDKSAYCQSILDGFGDKGATIPFACFIFVIMPGRVPAFLLDFLWYAPRHKR